MLIENIELTMSHLGLGVLNEYALMVLFGNAHSHHLVVGTDLRPDQLRDENATTLYPAYFMTRLQVPETVLLDTFKLWETVSIGVDVSRFGDTLLESRYIVGRQGQIPENAAAWSEQNLPTMEGNNLIVAESIDGATARRRVLNPHPDYIARLPKTLTAPKGITRSKLIRNKSFDKSPAAGIRFCSRQPFLYEVLAGRDAAPGHAMIFAKFCEVMDAAEYKYFTREFTPALPDELITCFSVIDREIYYYGNCYAGEVLYIRMSGYLDVFEEGEFMENCNCIRAAKLHTNFEIYQERNKTLLALARVTKLVAIPMEKQEVMSDLQRLFSQVSLFSASLP